MYVASAKDGIYAPDYSLNDVCYVGYYWVVQQILKKQLHNADEDCLQFTTTIMDKLEQVRLPRKCNSKC